MEERQKAEEGFSYTYSAEENQKFRREVEAIRTRYEEKDSRETKLEQLRKLDRKARSVSMTAALVLGIGGMLIFGTGMSLVLIWNFQVPGILVGILGMALMAAAYPVMKYLEKKCRKKYGPAILELSKELLERV